MKHRISCGDRFGRLTVIRFIPGRVVVRCECGAETRVVRGNLINGFTTSCGCWIREVTSRRSTVHGHTAHGKVSPTHKSWSAMLDRCTLESHPAWPRYGRAGIRVCDRWFGFTAFLEDMGERPSLNHSIDRIDNNGNYEPGNCRWATHKEQSRNSRRARMLEIDGQLKPLTEWAGISGVNPVTIHGRMKRGWEAKESVFAPLGSHKGEFQL
jgi:hypothetical protein